MMLGDKDIDEYYQPETGVGPPRAASSFGRSWALFIQMAIEASRANPLGVARKRLTFDSNVLYYRVLITRISKGY
jgi:hypothetical protein